VSAQGAETLSKAMREKTQLSGQVFLSSTCQTTILASSYITDPRAMTQDIARLVNMVREVERGLVTVIDRSQT
jgi:hypothetical protein